MVVMKLVVSSITWDQIFCCNKLLDLCERKCRHNTRFYVQLYSQGQALGCYRWMRMVVKHLRNFRQPKWLQKGLNFERRSLKNN